MPSRARNWKTPAELTSVSRPPSALPRPATPCGDRGVVGDVHRRPAGTGLRSAASMRSSAAGRSAIATVAPMSSKRPRRAEAEAARAAGDQRAPLRREDENVSHVRCLPKDAVRDRCASPQEARGNERRRPDLDLGRLLVADAAMAEPLQRQRRGGGAEAARVAVDHRDRRPRQLGKRAVVPADQREVAADDEAAPVDGAERADEQRQAAGEERGRRRGRRRAARSTSASAAAASCSVTIGSARSS